MPVTISLEEKPVKRIVANRDGQKKPPRQEIAARLAELNRQGRITDRDETLLELVREFNALNLNQIQRLLWRNATEKTAHRRAYFLEQHYLLEVARSPHAEMKQWGLRPRMVYILGVGGWMWLKDQIDVKIPRRQTRREQILHDMLVAEIYVKVVEAAALRNPAPVKTEPEAPEKESERWEVTWVGEEAAGFYRGDNPVISPDGLVKVKRVTGSKTQVLPFFVEFDKGREAHGTPSTDWGRKVGGYNRFCAGHWQMHPQLSNLPDSFPPVLVITHGKRRLLNLGRSIQNHRQQPVVYHLALWDEVMNYEDFLSAPVWLILTKDGQVIGKEPEDRQALLSPPVNSNAQNDDGQVSANGATPAANGAISSVDDEDSIAT